MGESSLSSMLNPSCSTALRAGPVSGARSSAFSIFIAAEATVLNWWRPRS